MANPNATVLAVLRLEPAPGRVPPAEALRAGPGISVELEGGRRARLDPSNRRSAGFARVLDALGRLKVPAYLEIEPANSSITRVLIPHLTRILDTRAGESGIEVDLESSHARHALNRGPDFEELSGRLRESREKGTVLLVTEDDDHQIIDVRDFKPTPETPLPPLPPFPKGPAVSWPGPLPWFEALWRWRWWPWWWLSRRCLSAVRAQEVFDAMAATTCEPLTVPPPCIPFMYPDDGCWGRAHEMCRLMILAGVSPKKVWIERAAPGYLHVNTRNNPNCYVEWGWHVAPTLCVRRWWFWGTEMVIDPSMFTTPVTKATWKAAQNNPGATLTDSDWSIFYLWGGVTDPTFAQTSQVLATYRLRLQLRSLGPAGPPPYANCP